MKIRLHFIAFLIFSFTQFIGADEPDTAYIFSYATEKNHNRNGLHYAWSIDQENWHAIGPEQRFLFCDFGAWGSQKRMITPFLFQDQEGMYHCIWSLNETVGQFAHAATIDLYNWKRQLYPEVVKKGNCMLPEVSYNSNDENYIITWLSDIDGKVKILKNTTKDFKNYTPTIEASEKDRLNLRLETKVNDVTVAGSVLKVPWSVIDELIKYQQWLTFHNQQRAENMAQDSVRFISLEPIDAEIILNPSKNKQISDMLIGVFFEDINYAADGGIYAELIQNRGFEYALSDKLGRDTAWTNYKAWSLSSSNAAFIIDTVNPIHPNNKHYAILDIKQVGVGLVNEGFDGIPVTSGERYNFSVFAKLLEESQADLIIRLINENGNVCGETKITNISTDWQKFKSVIPVTETARNAKIELVPQLIGRIAFDMVSLFPEKTFKGRENGLRTDIAQTIADIKPTFIRFPGGCVAHGDGLGNMYRWKNTIGPLEARKPQRNIWRYHQSAGLGYFEYFQYCEDIGAEPLPVLPAGVPCQNSRTGGHGQQGGIPMCEMDDYVQEVLDLIEWANGDKNTKWGKLRAEAGHPEPFDLKYVGIGNEDLITDIFEERFTMIYKTLRKKHPEITVIGTVGPFYMGTDYEEGWDLATRLDIQMVDEHYYQPPGWFINNQDFYDRYDRNKSKVYLGEYAAHLPGRPMNIETALSEALYLTCIERNGDIVSMTSFAPLLAKEGHTQWNPDLIYFNNTEVKPTVDYYVQKLFGNNVGDIYIPGEINLSNNDINVVKRIAFSIVKNTKNNDIIIKLVNLLPVEVNTIMNLNQLNGRSSTAVLHVLSGKPTDRNVKPVSGSMKISEKFEYTMPSYSFSVIRIKGE